MGYLLLALGFLALEGPEELPKRYVKVQACTARLQSTPHLDVRHWKRGYGTTKAVRLLGEAAKEVARRHPGGGPVRVGDMSWSGGGRMPPHLSHHEGRDADVGYFRLGEESRDPFFRVTRAKELDLPRTWTLLEALLRSGEVEYIFMDYTLQRALHGYARSLGLSAEALRPIFQYPRPSWERVGIIRWVKGHHTHFHVRFLAAETAIWELGRRLLGMSTPRRWIKQAQRSRRVHPPRGE